MQFPKISREWRPFYDVCETRPLSLYAKGVGTETIISTCLPSLGTSLGLSMATHSIIRTFSPTMGAYMYSTLGYSSLGLFGFIMNAAVAILINAHHPPGIE